MIDRPLNILIIDDSDLDAEAIRRQFKKNNVEAEFTRICLFDEIEEAFKQTHWDVILCDHFLPSFESFAVLALRNELGLNHVPFILVSGKVRIEDAIEAMRLGANDYLFKDELSRLVIAVKREIGEAIIRVEKLEAESELRSVNQKLKRTLTSLANTQGQLVTAERFKALGQMASGIAHDFNNALMKIYGTVEQIENAPGNSDYFRQARLQIDDAATVVRRLSEYYRNHSEDDDSVVEVGEILRDSKAFTSPKWTPIGGNRKNTIEIEVIAHEAIGAWGDSSKLREVLTNLIFNSCDAIGDNDGKITLEARRNDTEVEIIVSDNGPGMADDVKKRCLDPLYSTKGKDGTGLGLSIVEGIIKSIGGRIQVYTELGAGTAIVLTLKGANLEEQKTDQRPVATNGDKKSLKIAVIDDEKAIAELMNRMLQRMDHEVTTYINPEEAVTSISKNDYDLVFTDRSMPELSGDEVARRLREKRPELPIVMISGYGDLMNASDELPTGIDLVIGKPISADSVAGALAELFPCSAPGVSLSR